MKTIILDTDFLLQSLRWKIDVAGELRRILDETFDIAILDKTLDELAGKPNGVLALTYTKKFKIITTTRDKSVDELLLEYEPKEEIIVATQDKELKEKLKKRNIQLITIRKQSHLELV